MEPIFGLMLFIAAVLIVGVVAAKRGRSVGWYALASILGGLVLVLLISQAGGSGIAAGFGAFVAPVIALFVALAGKRADELAVERGAYGKYKKCPYCAEPVRREAVKCKHCGSQLPRTKAEAQQPAPPSDDVVGRG